MRNFCVLVSIAFVLSCSTDAVPPDTEPEDASEGLREGGIPFGVAVLLKEYSGGGNDGDYYLVEFPEGRQQAMDPRNISLSAGIPAGAGFMKNGKESILVFQEDPGDFFFTYDIVSHTSQMATYPELFPHPEDCFFNAGQVGWNNTTVFTFENSGCSEPPVVRLLARDLESGVVTELPWLENAYTGDTPHGMWLTDDYFLVQYDVRGPEAMDLNREGLAVYRTDTYEAVFSTDTPSIKNIYIDGDQLLIAHRLDSVELMDLNDQENKITTKPVPDFPENIRIENTSIRDGKIGCALIEGNFKFPAYYDIRLNQYRRVERDPYLAFFKRDTIDFTADVLSPDEFHFDMASETFAITYHIFDPGESVPKSSAIVFLDFEGKVLFQHEFPAVPYLPVRLIRP